MILQLMPDQCSKYWEDIKGTIKMALPPMALATDEAMSNILAGLLNSSIQAWAALDGSNTVAVAVTVIQESVGDKTKNLLIYALAGYGNISQETWSEGFQVLKKFAASQGCHKMVAFTCVPRVLEIARGLGATVDYRLLEWEV